MLQRETIFVMSRRYIAPSLHRNVARRPVSQQCWHIGTLEVCSSRKWLPAARGVIAQQFHRGATVSTASLPACDHRAAGGLARVAASGRMANLRMHDWELASRQNGEAASLRMRDWELAAQRNGDAG